MPKDTFCKLHIPHREIRMNRYLTSAVRHSLAVQKFPNEKSRADMTSFGKAQAPHPSMTYILKIERP